MTLQSLARTIAKARHGTDAMWANYMGAAEAVAALYEADVKDAARYRWLRADNAYAPEEETITGGAELDELCDEEMRRALIAQPDGAQ